MSLIESIFMNSHDLESNCWKLDYRSLVWVKSVSFKDFYHKRVRNKSIINPKIVEL